MKIDKKGRKKLEEFLQTVDEFTNWYHTYCFSLQDFPKHKAENAGNRVEKKLKECILYLQEKKTKKPILIWKFDNAPDKLKIGVDDDDADWLAVIPLDMKDEYIPFLEEGGGFGVCSVEDYERDKYIIRVGYHA